LIFGLTIANYLFGLRIAASSAHKKKLLCAGVAVNVLTLGFFKYAYFGLDVANNLIKPLGGHALTLPWAIILPLGISFFVFEFIHYLAEVYKGSPPVKSFVDFALFAAFFPTQIAGPIKRYQDFIPQLSQERKFDVELLDGGLWFIVLGLVKKVVFADNLAPVVESAFSHPELMTGLDLWMAVYAFAFQVYFDFSGYTDIARGSAKLLGFKVPDNFNLPYLSGSIVEVWHRWHMSLSTWLRDYLYIPLGGSRDGKLMTCRNLFITMFIAGLWHGAGLQYITWGIYHGVLLIAHRVVKQFTDKFAFVVNLKAAPLFHVFSVLLTFHCVLIGYVFFRSDSFARAISILGKMLSLGELTHGAHLVPGWAVTIFNTADPIIFGLLPFILVMLAIGHVFCGWMQTRPEPFKFPPGAKAVYVAVLIGLLLVFTPDTSPKFVYFQF